MQSEQQFYKFILTLDNKFLKWFYTHKLISEKYNFWKDKEGTQKILFGGLRGSQFKTLTDMESFNTAFDDLLAKFNIPETYKHPLLYFMISFEKDYEAQSIGNNQHNRLIEYAQFILNLYENSKRHFEAMKKNAAYQMIYDEDTREYLFAKKSLYESMPLEELVEFIPDEKHADDIIRYLRVKVGHAELYLPPGMNFTVQGKGTLKNLLGETISFISIPDYLQSLLFVHTIDLMIKEHERANTDFYQCLDQEHVSDTDLRKIYGKYKKLQISKSSSLLKVAILIRDYLKHQKLITVKSQTADFIWGYFSLFKAFTVKGNQVIPNDYQELPQFYSRNRITSEYVRMMLKDVGEI